MKTDIELTEGSKHFFENDKDLRTMYATEDGQYFYEHAKNHALNHTSANKLKDALLITRDSVFNSAPKEPVKETVTEPIIEKKVEAPKEESKKETPKVKQGKKA